MYEDILTSLCQPYLLDLIGLLAECLKRTEHKVALVAKDSGHDIPNEVLLKIQELDYFEKAQVLAVAAGHIRAIAERDNDLYQ